MSFLGSLFGSGPSIKSWDNPYVSELANQSYNFGPAKRYYHDILRSAKNGDYGAMPGMGMFNQAIGSGYKDIERQADPLSLAAAGEGGGPLGDRIQEIQKEKLRDQVNSQRYGFAQNQLSDAAGGLSNMFARMNQFNLDKLQGAANAENARHTVVGGQPGILNSLIGGAAQVGGAYLGRNS